MSGGSAERPDVYTVLDDEGELCKNDGDGADDSARLVSHPASTEETGWEFVSTDCADGLCADREQEMFGICDRACTAEWRT